VEPLLIPSGRAVLDVIPRLLAALDGTGPALLPTTAGESPSIPPILGPDEDNPDDPTALLVRTSGSTGEPKLVVLPASALRHSAAVGQRRLHDGKPGTWLLCLPAQHIAGLNVLLRAALAGHEPIVLNVAQPFTVTSFAAATAQLPTGPAFVSLVPTQLHRLLDQPAGIEALLRFTSVLVGGAATGPTLIERSRRAGVAIVTSYGMSETCGGCVYDGRPLDGVDIQLDTDSRISMAGPVVARGYLGRPLAAPFDGTAGRRRFKTNDLGRFEPDGTLAILGRADDVLISGGVNISPQAVEQVLAAVTGVGELIVTGVSDPEWGQVLVAVVVPTGVGPTLADLRSRSTRALGPAAAPRHLVVVDALPTKGPGKPDRTAIADLARRAITAGLVQQPVNAESGRPATMAPPPQ
jgi:O-succinylbenzoic acid--CoA ligase